MLNKNIVVLGASENPQRYSNRAQKLLTEHGYHVFPVARVAGEILGVEAVSDLSDVQVPIDTVTIYLRPKILETLIDKIIAAKPRRVIFNPGSESAELAAQLKSENIVVTEACTLVLLSTGQFELDEG